MITIMKTQIKDIKGEIIYESENPLVETIIEAVRERTDLSHANLRYANLSGVDLSGASIRANLRGADLRYTDLRYANLSGADLIGADIRYSNLSGVNLSYANLSGADLRGANLNRADLAKVMINEHTCMFAINCPEEGSFIGWKKADGFIVKLLITEDAIRSSATSLKCRCSKAKVLEIQKLDGSRSILSSVSSSHDRNFRYKIGETVEVASFNLNRWEECSTGIHFFINRELAVQYG